MRLSSGTRLGPYEIIASIGAGGMGEVYRAKDTKLDREVAIKILPDAWSNDAERLIRFDREAKVLASLNHPHIAQIYGVEDRAIVMELVAGESLDSLLRRGPLPLETALQSALQIAEALEAAHEKGIVHRDLKPANIVVTADGGVKVLDFGLAAVALGSSAEAGDPANSPTITMRATQAGVIMGTAAYMSPEQASGKPVDKRSDIWSFGVVLWEMLTAQHLFSGETVSHTLADVLRAPIDLNKLPEGVPAPVRDLVGRCLARDVKSRLRDIGEARIAIQKYLANPISETTSAAPAGRQRSWPWMALAGALALALAGVLIYQATRPAPSRPLIRLSVDLGPEAVPRGVIISPDGTRIAYIARAPQDQEQLFTRRLDQRQSVALPGTLFTSVTYPFFSPDGQWIGFFAAGKIRKVAAEGGSALVLGQAPVPSYGATWGDDGNIYFGSGDGLKRIPASGGALESVTDLGGIVAFPQLLPGARALLFNAAARTRSDSTDAEIEVLRFDTGKVKQFPEGGLTPLYLPTFGKTGHLVYVNDGTLFGVSFDPQHAEISGNATPLLDDVNTTGTGAGDVMAFSNTGTLVYMSGNHEVGDYSVLTMDASGKTAPLIAQRGEYRHPRFSPDGKRLAYVLRNGKGVDVWVYDLERETPTQLTFTNLGSGNRELAWAPDSNHLVYGDGSSLWWIRVDGAGQPQRLLDKADNPRPYSIAPDGRLAFSSGPTLPDIWTLPVDLSDPEHPRAGKAEAFLADPRIVEVDPAFSPDGKFLAYASSESGSEQIFVRSFPGPGGKWKISTEGGKFPVWSRAGHDLLFLGGDDRIMVVSYAIQNGTFSAGRPRAWSPTQVRRTGVGQNFDLSPDGKHVAAFERPAVVETPGSLHATFLLNFFDEVRRKIPAGK